MIGSAYAIKSNQKYNVNNDVCLDVCERTLFLDQNSQDLAELGCHLVG